MFTDQGYLIHNLSFRPDGLTEISYALDSEEVEDAAMLRTVVFEETVFASEVSALRTTIANLIDEVSVYLRNPDARAHRSPKKDKTEDAQGDGFSTSDF